MAAITATSVGKTHRVNGRNIHSPIPADVQNVVFSWCHDVNLDSIASLPIEITLTRLEFRGYTCFRNIKVLLQRCRNLKVVEFATIGLSHYPGTESLPRLTLENVNEVRFKGNGPLTRHELQLLEYFSERISFGVLTTVTMTDGAGFQAPGDDNVFSNYLHPSLLIGWLLQNSGTIRNLEIRRPGVILAPNEHEDILRLQLENFIFRSNTVGFDHILSAQASLQTLGFLRSASTRPSKGQLVMDFIEKRGSTLKEITFEHKVLHTLDDMKMRNTPDCEAHDCRIYLDCRQLEQLSIESSILEDPERRQRRPGTVKNLSFLPLSLVRLEIKVDHLNDPEEVNCLELILSRMGNLRDFQMRGNMQSPFPVKMTLIELLVGGMKQLLHFELKFCHLEEFPRLLEYVQTKPQFKSVILLSPNSVCCRKSQE